MTRRRGFTLIEVTLGLVLTGLVALLSYGALASASDTRQALQADRTRRRAEAAWRELVSGTVRSLRLPAEYDAATLSLRSGVDGRGRPADELVLVTAAGAPPLAPGIDWRVTLSTDGDGVVARAEPLGRGDGVRSVRAPAGTRGVETELLYRGSWVSSWSSDSELPEALRLTFWDEEGPTGNPLVVALPGS